MSFLPAKHSFIPFRHLCLFCFHPAIHCCRDKDRGFPIRLLRRIGHLLCRFGQKSYGLITPSSFKAVSARITLKGSPLISSRKSRFSEMNDCCSHPRLFLFQNIRRRFVECFLESAGEGGKITISYFKGNLRDISGSLL